MNENTNPFEKQWKELQSLIANSENAKGLSEKIKVFYGQMDQKAGKKRQALQGRDQAHPPQEKENAAGVKATTFEVLQRSLVRTACKIYECNNGVPDEDDEEKCRRAEEFVEEVLSEFKRMHFPAVAFLQRCFLCSNREPVMAAVPQDGLALQLASGDLKNNQEVVIAAVRVENSPECFFTNTLQCSDMAFAIDIHRDHDYLCNSTSLAELLEKSWKLKQAFQLLKKMEESAEGDPRLQTRIQHQGDDPYSLKRLIALKRKQLDKRLERVDNKLKETTIEEVQRLQLAPCLREEQIQQSRKHATRQLAALWENKMNSIPAPPLDGDFTISAEYFCVAAQQWTTQMVEEDHWEEDRVEEILTEFCGICVRFKSQLVELVERVEDLIINTDCSSAEVGIQTVPHLHSGSDPFAGDSILTLSLQ